MRKGRPVQLYEFVVLREGEERRYFISCANDGAALKAASRMAQLCAVKVLRDGALVGEAEGTRWKWNARRLSQPSGEKR
jgi:hypothetical protein